VEKLDETRCRYQKSQESVNARGQRSGLEPMESPSSRPHPPRATRKLTSRLHAALIIMAGHPHHHYSTHIPRLIFPLFPCMPKLFPLAKCLSLPAFESSTFGGQYPPTQRRVPLRAAHLFCSSRCSERAVASFHRVTCGKPFGSPTSTFWTHKVEIIL
jgi:hypothetical protein